MFDSVDPSGLAYYERNRCRGRAHGQVTLRIRYRDRVTPWFDLLNVAPRELEPLLARTGWKVAELVHADGARLLRRAREGGRRSQLHSPAEMTGERIRLEVSERDGRGSRDARRLRKTGMIPGVLYGRGKKPHAICIPERSLRAALTGGAGLHAILDVVLEGQKTVHPAILKDYQQDVIRGTLTHVDLHEVRLDQPIQTQVVVELVGGDDAPGVRAGGVLAQVTREVNVEALPMEIPEHLELDVSAMELGDTIRLADMPLPEGLSLVDDPEGIVLATLTQPTRVEEPEEVTEAGEPLTGVPTDADQKPQGAADAPAEPGADAAGSPGTVEG